MIETNQAQDTQVRQLIALLQLYSTKDSVEFATKVIEFMAQVTKAYQGIFYVCQPENQVIYTAGTYATSLQKDFDYGEGLVGQVVLSKRLIYLHHTSSKQNYSNGFLQFVPNTAIILPLTFNQEVYGVIELVFLQTLPSPLRTFLERVAGHIGASLYNLLANQKTEELLQDSQVHTKKLQKATEKQVISLDVLKKVREKLIKQQKELEAEHLKTQQSIQYAKRIQKAFLPTETTRLSIFPKSFLLYLPKDIVSGDFFWCSKHGKRRIIAVADCTGHGVPGAFMSIVGNNLMNEIVNQQNITCPASILTKMHQGIREKLSQDESQNDDGMDMTICAIEPKDNQTYYLTFGGAKHLMIVIDKQKQLKVLKGDRKSVGGKNTTHDRQFTNQELFVKSEEMLYLFSDGYTDQPNPKRRSVGHIRLQKLLLSVADLSTQKQQESILDFLEKYRENTPQRDDITLLGIRV